MVPTPGLGGQPVLSSAATCLPLRYPVLLPQLRCHYFLPVGETAILLLTPFLQRFCSLPLSSPKPEAVNSGNTFTYLVSFYEILKILILMGPGWNPLVDAWQSGPVNVHVQPGLRMTNFNCSSALEVILLTQVFYSKLPKVPLSHLEQNMESLPPPLLAVLRDTKHPLL